MGTGMSIDAERKCPCPLWGQQKFHKRNFCGGLDNDMGMGMDIAAERKCPCPLWGLVLARG